MNSAYHIKIAFFYSVLWAKKAMMIVLLLQLTVELLNAGKFKSVEYS